MDLILFFVEQFAKYWNLLRIKETPLGITYMQLILSMLVISVLISFITIVTNIVQYEGRDVIKKNVSNRLGWRKSNGRNTTSNRNTKRITK